MSKYEHAMRVKAENYTRRAHLSRRVNRIFAALWIVIAIALAWIAYDKSFRPIYGLALIFVAFAISDYRKGQCMWDHWMTNRQTVLDNATRERAANRFNKFTTEDLGEDWN